MSIYFFKNKACNFSIFILVAALMLDCKSNVRDDQETGHPQELVNDTIPRRSDQIKLGINRTDLYWVAGGNAAQYDILNKIKASNCNNVRLTLQSSNYKEQVRDHILYCNKIGLKPLVCIMLGGISEIYPPGTTVTNRLRPGEARVFWDTYPVSSLDETLLENFMRDLLTYWHDAGCIIDVIEMGNELNWIDFNGDFPYYANGEGRIFDSSYTWNTLPVNVRMFARKAGFATQKTKELINSIYKANAPKVIVGGLSSGNLNYGGWLKSVGGSVMSAEMALRIMQGTAAEQPAGSENYLSGIDAICVHLYPYNDCPFVGDDSGRRADTTRMIQDAVNYFEKWMPAVNAVTDLPVYITEFGYETVTYGVSNDWKRAEQFNAFIIAMNKTKAKHNWEALYIYNWDSGTFQIYNGKPLPSAKGIFGR